MAVIRKIIDVAAAPEFVWDALRAVGALHHRLVPGFVIDTFMDGPARIVTFDNGMTAREVIVSVDDSMRRVCYFVDNPNLAHHSASAEVFAFDGGSRIVWTCDVLPDAAAAGIEPMMARGAEAMAAHFGR